VAALTLKAILAALALLLAGSQVCAQVIPPDRRIAWSPGVRGVIPSPTSIINVRHPPFNATGDGTTDDRPAIQRALDSAPMGQVVYLPRGTYRIGGGLLVKKPITLRGDGPDETIIDYTAPHGAHVLRTIAPGGHGPQIAIVSASERGSTSITVPTGAAILEKDYIVIAQDNIDGLVFVRGARGECRWCGNDVPSQTMTQVNRVVAKNGNVLTLERPLYFDFKHNPVVRRLTMLQNVGVEDLQLRRSNSSSRNGHNFYLRGCANCWLKNVRSDKAGHRHVQLENSYANTIRDSWFSDGYDHGPDRSYGIFLFAWNSDHLIENNIIYRTRHALILEGGGSGNVFAYNYAVGSITDPDNDWLAEDMATHGAHPFMNLFEGNIVSKLSHDNTWGSSSHNTTFRCLIQNYSSGAATPISGRYAVDVEAHNYDNNIVGSVLGRRGDVGARYHSGTVSRSSSTSYRFGFESPGRRTLSDKDVQPRTLIHGNYDHIGGSVVWDPSRDRNLPPSLYLSAKPAWFGAIRWPPFGPDLEPMEGTIPAKVRYERGAIP
jgi:hypothetical protein